MDDKEQEIIPPTIQETDEMWGRLLVQIKDHERKKRKRKIIGALSGMAAVLVITGGLITYRSYASPDIYTAALVNKKIILADNSEITLLKGAKLTVEKSFPSNTRDVFLEGDAIFKVTKSKEHPFVVHGHGYQTKVLGTVFKISQSGENFQVDLYEGNVQINKNEKKQESFILRPAETFSNMGSSKVATIFATTTLKQKAKSETATLSLTAVPLNKTVKILENTYGIKVYYPASLAQSIVSVNSKNVTADELIQIIAIQLKLNTKIKNDNTFQLEE